MAFIAPEPASFITNAHADVTTGEFLKRAGAQFLGANVDTSQVRTSSCLEFLAPNPAIDWNAVLPKWCWVSAGGMEIMFDDIARWFRAREGDLGTERITSEFPRHEVHVYQWLETVDNVKKRKFLGTEHGDGPFESIDRIGRAIGGRCKVHQS